MNLLIKPEETTRIFYITSEETRDKESGGYDIFCPDDVTIYPGQTIRVDMKVKCVFEKNNKSQHYFLLTRSSIDKTPLALSNSVGLMDKNYRGNVIASFRHIFPNDPPYTIKRGQRLVQLLPVTGEDYECKIVDRLSSTTRGENGFGSSGE